MPTHDALDPEDMLTIGKVASRLGITVSAVRFYSDRGLIPADRGPGGQRLFPRSSIRRISFLLVAQRLGYSLEEISAILQSLPNSRTPTEQDWEHIGAEFRVDLDRRVAELTQLSERLSGCIGCGCLSLARCQLINKDDSVGSLGDGPRFLMGDSPIKTPPPPQQPS